MNDRKAFSLLSSLPHNPYLRCIKTRNEDGLAAFNAFQRTGKVPTFSYPIADTFDVEVYRAALLRVREEIAMIHDMHPIVHGWYTEKLDEMGLRADLVESIQKKDDHGVTHISEQLFGVCDIQPTALEKQFEQFIAIHTPGTPTRNVTAQHIHEAVTRILQHYGMKEWDVSFTDAHTFRIKHGHAHTLPRIQIPKNITITKSRAIRLLAHEIEGHALRTDNGRKSPYALLGRGLARYLQTEEGIALYAQRQYHPKRLMQPSGFWNIWAVSLAKHTRFSTTFHTLATAKARVYVKQNLDEHQAKIKAERFAWQLCMRTYRGIHNPEQGQVAFMRDHIYYQGFHAINTFMKATPEKQALLYAGNLDTRHLADVQQLNLIGRVPDMIAEDVLHHVLQHNV